MTSQTQLQKQLSTVLDLLTSSPAVSGKSSQKTLPESMASTQQLASLLMACLQNKSPLLERQGLLDEADASVLKQKYEDLQVMYKKCMHTMAKLQQQHKSERAELVQKAQTAAKKKDAKRQAAIAALVAANSSMEQILAETKDRLQKETEARITLQGQLASVQQDARRHAMQELLESNQVDDNAAAKLEARLEAEELRYHCEILQEELFHARSCLEAASWAAHEFFSDYEKQLQEEKEAKAAEKANKVEAKAVAKSKKEEAKAADVKSALPATNKSSKDASAKATAKVAAGRVAAEGVKGAERPRPNPGTKAAEATGKLPPVKGSAVTASGLRGGKTSSNAQPTGKEPGTQRAAAVDAAAPSKASKAARSTDSMRPSALRPNLTPGRDGGSKASAPADKLERKLSSTSSSGSLTSLGERRTPYQPVKGSGAAPASKAISTAGKAQPKAAWC